VPVSGTNGEVDLVLKTPSAQRNRAFTLLELMVVIAIVVVLAGLLFPAVQSVLERAKKVQAKNDLTQIVTAVNAYYTEYGKYPIVTDDTPPSNTSDLLYTLRAVASGANASNATNPRQVAFLNLPDAKDSAKPRSGVGGDGQYYDPWGQTYKVAIDGTYDNQIANPYGNNNGAGSDPLRQGVIAWSLGKDTTLGNSGNFTNSDDVISWQ
jgi:prepilin-type N-terminal cleavage/methylation domain-containing protein